ncbi:MAG: Bug family tripartite tricarboxylate transporter substrate binding protein [Beijerinckiaceae bacterium]
MLRISPARPAAFGLTVAALLAYAPAPAAAQEYKAKQVKMVIGFGPGGGYDRWARTIAQYIGNHLPGKPTVVSQNMPGAGSFVALNWLASIAPKDGSVIAAVARDAPLGPLTGNKNARFDTLKLSWIGTPTSETNVCIAHKNAKVKSVEDLMKQELLVADTGPGTGTHVYPIVLREILGMKFKLISGYQSSSTAFLAMERGEVDGICESYDSVGNKKPDWIPNGTVKVLFQAGTAPEPHIKAPYILDFAKTDEQKKALKFLYAGQGIGRPYVAPPGLPPAILKAMRDAFNATMKDPAFRADAKKQRLDVEPKTGEQLKQLVEEIYATPKDLVAKIGALIKK